MSVYAVIIVCLLYAVFSCMYICKPSSTTKCECLCSNEPLDLWSGLRVFEIFAVDLLEQREDGEVFINAETECECADHLVSLSLRTTNRSCGFSSLSLPRLGFRCTCRSCYLHYQWSMHNAMSFSSRKSNRFFANCWAQYVEKTDEVLHRSIGKSTLQHISQLVNVANVLCRIHSHIEVGWFHGFRFFTTSLRTNV